MRTIHINKGVAGRYVDMYYASTVDVDTGNVLYWNPVLKTWKHSAVEHFDLHCYVDTKGELIASLMANCNIAGFVDVSLVKDEDTEFPFYYSKNGDEVEISYTKGYGWYVYSHETKLHWHPMDKTWVKATIDTCGALYHNDRCFLANSIYMSGTVIAIRYISQLDKYVIMKYNTMAQRHKFLQTNGDWRVSIDPTLGLFDSKQEAELCFTPTPSPQPVKWSTRDEIIKLMTQAEEKLSKCKKLLGQLDE